MVFLLKFSCFCNNRKQCPTNREKKLVTHNQECKKIKRKRKIKMEGYLHFLVGMKHDSHYITQFSICKHIYSMIKSLH